MQLNTGGGINITQLAPAFNTDAGDGSSGNQTKDDARTG